MSIKQKIAKFKKDYLANEVKYLERGFATTGDINFRMSAELIKAFSSGVFR